MLPLVQPATRGKGSLGRGTEGREHVVCREKERELKVLWRCVWEARLHYFCSSQNNLFFFSLSLMIHCILQYFSGYKFPWVFFNVLRLPKGC